MFSIELRQQKLFFRDIKYYLTIATGVITLLVLVALGLTWFGTNAQISVSTTLTYAGRERSLTQKLLAESLLTVYAQDAKAKKNLQADEIDWTQRHDALWRGDNTLHVLSVSSYPDIMPSINKVEPLYLELHVAINDVLTAKDQVVLRRDANIINTDAVPFYNAMEAYNTYLRNLTTQYQNTILLYGICSTSAILLVLALSILIIFRPAFARLDTNLLAIAQSDEQLKKQHEDTQVLLEEVRRADHGTRVPVLKIRDGLYAVQNGMNGYYEVMKADGIYKCPCPIYTHNHFCNHIKYAQYAERGEAQQQQISQQLFTNGKLARTDKIKH